MYKKIILLLSISLSSFAMEKAQTFKSSSREEQHENSKASYYALDELETAQELIRLKYYEQAIINLEKIVISEKNQPLDRILLNRKKLLLSIACYHHGNEIDHSDLLRYSSDLIEEILSSEQPTDEYYQSALNIKRLFNKNVKFLFNSRKLKFYYFI